MAEVKINIIAVDKASSVINKVREAAEGAVRYITELGNTFKGLGDSAFTSITSTLSLDTLNAQKTITDFASAVKATPIEAILSLNTFSAISQVLDARQMIDQLFPESGIHKYIYVHTVYVGAPAQGEPKHGGTYYIPQTGLYPLLQGEAVLNRAETKNMTSATNNQTINYSPQITISNPSGDIRDLERMLVKRMDADRNELGKIGSLRLRGAN